MMIEWEEDKRWSDIFIPEIKSILGQLLIGEASVEDDQLKNTDLIVLELKGYRIGCRVRKHFYFIQYPNDFTIRCSRPSGVSTEFDKIMKGWGDYLFYAFANKEENRLIAWKLIDLKQFREYVDRYWKENNGIIPGKEISNTDGSSVFRAFDSTKDGKAMRFVIPHSWDD